MDHIIAFFQSLINEFSRPGGNLDISVLYYENKFV